MNLRKNLGRVASTIVATALLASVATVPAFAVGEPAAAEINNTSNFSIDKVIEKDAGVYLPVTTFTFKITPDEADPNEVVDVTETNQEGIVVEDGIIGVFPNEKIKGEAPNQYAELNATINNNVNTDENKEAASVTVSTDSIALDGTAFDHAGVYKYEIVEVEGDYEGVSYDTTPKTLYIYVGYADENAEAAATLSVLYTVVVDDGETAFVNGKTNNVVNEYGVGGTDNQIGTLTVEKTVSGTQGDKNTPFEFTIVITGAAGEKYGAKILTPNAEGQYTEEALEAPFTSGESKTISLKHGQKIVIDSLSASDQYVITETAANKNNYTTTVTKTTASDTVADETMAVTGTIATASTEDDADAVDQGKVITFNNDRDASTPTGIVMNVAPYALLVVVAVAGCFVFLRKRNED